MMYFCITSKAIHGALVTNIIGNFGYIRENNKSCTNSGCSLTAMEDGIVIVVWITEIHAIVVEILIGNKQ